MRNLKLLLSCLVLSFNTKGEGLFLFPLLVDNDKTLLRTLPTRSRTCWTNLERAASRSMSWTGSGGGFRSVIVVDIIAVFVFVGVRLLLLMLMLLFLFLMLRQVHP